MQCRASDEAMLPASPYPTRVSAPPLPTRPGAGAHNPLSPENRCLTDVAELSAPQPLRHMSQMLQPPTEWAPRRSESGYPKAPEAPRQPKCFAKPSLCRASCSAPYPCDGSTGNAHSLICSRLILTAQPIADGGLSGSCHPHLKPSTQSPSGKLNANHD